MIKVRVSVFSPPSLFCRRLKDCLEPFTLCKNMQFYVVAAAAALRATWLKGPVCHFVLVIYFFSFFFIRHNHENPLTSAQSLRHRAEGKKKRIVAPKAPRPQAEVGVGFRGEGAESAGHSLLIDPGRWNAAEVARR